MMKGGSLHCTYVASTVIIKTLNNIIIEDAAVNNYTCKFIIKLQGVAKVTGFVPYMQLRTYV